MKKGEFYRVEDPYIYFHQSNKSYRIDDFKRVTVRIKPVLKNVWNTLLNVTTNAMTSSIGNGNEQVQIIVDVTFGDGIEEIVMNEKVLIRGNLDYYEMLEHAKRLKAAIKRDIKDEK